MDTANIRDQLVMLGTPSANELIHQFGNDLKYVGIFELRNYETQSAIYHTEEKGHGWYRKFHKQNKRNKLKRHR